MAMYHKKYDQILIDEVDSHIAESRMKQGWISYLTGQKATDVRSPKETGELAELNEEMLRDVAENVITAMSKKEEDHHVDEPVISTQISCSIDSGAFFLLDHDKDGNPNEISLLTAAKVNIGFGQFYRSDSIIVCFEER